MRLLGIHERDGSKYVLEHRVLRASGECAMNFGRSDWADWSIDGSVLVARAGRLYRVSVDENNPGELQEVADTRSLRFEEVTTPHKATLWSGRVTNLR